MMTKATIRNPYAKRPRPSAGSSGETAPRAPKQPQSYPTLRSSGDATPATFSSPSFATSKITSHAKKVESAANTPNTAALTTTANPTTETASALVIAACDKAGMDGIDRKRIDAIILRESGNSLYMKQQRRRDEQVNERIAGLKRKLAQAPPGWDKEISKQMDREIPEILARRSSRSTAVVVDVSILIYARWNFVMCQMDTNIWP